MKYVKKVARAIGLKVIYNILQDVVLKLRGYNLLSLDNTTAFMAPYMVKTISGIKAILPQIPDAIDDKKNIFPHKESNTDAVYVWDYQNKGKLARISKYGSVIIDRKVPCIDWNHGSLYKDIWKKDTRIKQSVPVAIALFSQFQDGIFYGGYYDFIFLVLTKVARIKEALPDLDLANIPVTYPLFNTSYETEYLQLLGVDTDNLIDSKKTQITTLRLITANSAHWYPNLEDVLCLKKHILKKVRPVKTAQKRVYISRKNRRCITNEEELIVLLKKFNFEIIEDKKRTVAEQIAIYYNASFIIGPHGASFSNVIWCEPGAHLFELFSPNYAPDFFLYLAKVMGMGYSAYYEGVADSKIDYLQGLVEDITVSIPKLEKCLQGIFAADAKK